MFIKNTVIISSKHRKNNSKHIHNLAIIIQINANCNLHIGLRTISKQRISRKIRDTVYQRIRIQYLRDKLLHQSRKNLLQQNVPILLGRIQIRTILQKINIQQNERTKLFLNNNISKQKHHLLCHPDEGRVT